MLRSEEFGTHSEVEQMIESVSQYMALLWHDEAGVSSVEYAFLLAVLSLGAIMAFANLSTEVQAVADTTSAEMREASGMGCSSG